MPRTSISGRLQALLLGVFVIACTAYLSVRFWPQDRVEELLRQMPANAAIVAYVDMPRLTDVAADASMPLSWSLGLAVNRLAGVSLALSGRELYVAAGGDFSATLIDALLASRGIGCGVSLEVEPCSVNLGHGPVLLRIVQPGTLVATTAASLGSASPGEVSGSEVRDAIQNGAVIWAAIDPQLLDAAMAVRPPNWINLQIVARALEPARVAYLTVSPLNSDQVAIHVEAHCDAADREQLEQVLAGLNDMALALLARDASVASQWRSALESFESSQGAETVQVQWTLSVKQLAELWGQAD